jgi:putative glutamine amidotransferase
MTLNQTPITRRPIVGVTSCIKSSEGQRYHHAGEKYHRAIAECTNAIPLAIPSMGDVLDADAVIDVLDGVLFTGSPSNVFPPRYGVAENASAEPYDQIRDAMTLPLLSRAIERGIPVLAICRGFQELNVVTGGSLHARVHELSDRMDHRRPDDPSVEVQYGPVHSITLRKESLLASILNSAGSVDVNSLHWQAIDRLGDSLQINATAPDGTIEAVSMPTAKGFVLGVQWHPEYEAKNNAVSRAIFAAFNNALRS